MWECFCGSVHETDACQVCGATPETAAFERMMRHPYTKLILTRLKARVASGHNPEYTPICSQHAAAMSEWLTMPAPDDFVPGKECCWCAMARKAELRSKGS